MLFGLQRIVCVQVVIAFMLWLSAGRVGGKGLERWNGAARRLLFEKHGRSCNESCRKKDNAG